MQSHISSKGLEANSTQSKSYSSTKINLRERYNDFGHCVEFSTILADNLVSQLTRCFSSDDPFSYSFKPTGVPEADGELSRFRYALLSYRDSYKPVMTVDFLINGLRKGSEFISELKRIRVKSFVRSIDGFFAEFDEDMDKTISIPIEDIGQVFNFRYYFFWESPDEHDEQYFFKPLKKPPKEDLDRFEQVVYDLLPDEVEKIQEEEILLDVTSSKGLGPRNEKSQPVWKLKESFNHFTREPLFGKSSFLQTYPGSTRFAITLSVPHSNTIKLIEKQVAEIAAEVPWSAYVKDPDEFDKRFKRFHSEHTFFYCRDLKKDGITKPRFLVQRTLAAIKRKYPDLPANKYFEIFDSFSFQQDGIIYHPPRGVGLGMSAAITTIIQSALFKITLEDMRDADIDIMGEINALEYHDDMEIGFTEECDFHVYDEFEDRTMIRYGCIKNKKKSFYGKQGVLCERYSGKFNKKDSMIKYVLYLPFAACNIVHAKQMFVQSLSYLNNPREDWYPYLQKLVDFWGYEFCPNEVHYPASFGGWLPSRYSRVDTSLVALSRIPEYQVALMNASRLHELPYKGKDEDDKVYRSPFSQIYPGLDYGDQGKTYFVNLTHNDMNKMFKNRDRFGSTKNFWTYNLNQRNKIFNELKDIKLDEKEVYLMYNSLHSDKDVLPPRSQVRGIGVDLDKLQRGYDPHIPANRRLSYLKFLNNDKMSDKIIPYPIPPGIGIIGKKGLTAHERRDFIDLDFMDSEFDFFGMEVPLPDYKIVSNEWYDCNSVIGACINYYDIRTLPKGIYKESLKGYASYNKKLIEMMDGPFFSVFSRIVDRVGVKRALNLDYNILNEEVTKAYLNQLRIAKQKIKDEIIDNLEFESVGDRECTSSLVATDDIEVYAESQYSDMELKDEDYFVWLTNHNQKRCKDWRFRYFENIYDKTQQLKYDLLLGDSLKSIKCERNDDCKLSTIEAFLYRKSGGILDSEGFPEIHNHFYLLEGGDKAESEYSDDQGGFAMFGE